MSFLHLNVPDQWNQYFTKYPQGYTMLEALMNWVQQVNDMTDNVNSWNDYLETFEQTYDIKLDDSVKAQLLTWLNDGTLENIISDFMGKFDVNDHLVNQQIIGTVPNTENGAVPFIQGGVFNQAANELYIVRKDSTQANNMLYRYDATTFVLKDYKPFTTSTGCFNEGLAYFYNAGGDLCFIVRTSYDFTAAIFNYTKNTITPNFTCYGSSKHGMDNNSKYYFAHYGDADTVEGIFLFDLQSVINQTPTLLKKIHFPRNIADGEKVQSIGIVDDLIYLGHGKQYPQVSVLNFSGSVVKEHSFDKDSLAAMIKAQYPDFTYSNYAYENEGTMWYTENGKTFPVIAHCVHESNKTYLTKLGNPFWQEVTQKVYTTNIDGKLNWKNVTYDTTLPSFAPTDYGADVPVQYAKDDRGMVYLRGVATYTRDPANTTTGAFDYGNKVLFTLPYPYAPFRNNFFNQQASGGADKQAKIEIDTAGHVMLSSVYDQGGSAKPFLALDGIFFYVDTRTV